MLRSGTNLAFLFFFFVNAVQYFIWCGAVRCGAVRFGAVRCIHTRFIDRFFMSEGGDPLSLTFTSKTEQSHSAAQNRLTSCCCCFLLY